MYVPLRFKPFFLLCMGLLLLAIAQPVQAQTKSARGINMSSSAIGAVVPELGTLESEILETVTLMEDIENCAQNSRFYDPVSENCRTTDPVNVEFEQRPDETTVTVQRPNGTSVAYPLDGADGVARDEDGDIIDPDTPDTPDTPDEPDTEEPDEEASSTDWVIIDRRVDASEGCAMSEMGWDCMGDEVPGGQCRVGAQYTTCRNLIGNFKCLMTKYECQ